MPAAYDVDVGILALLLTLFAFDASAAWLRGNTHTHTDQSDGDSSPADVVRWYQEHGYDFLVITDHDKVTPPVEGTTMVLIPGEEITDRLPKRPLHVNAIGIDKAIAPGHGETAVEVLQKNIAAVREAGGIAAVNHPNFGWAISAEELLAVDGFTLLEIASGHPYVNMEGPPSVEAMWDTLLTAGRRVWGIAVDDSHHLLRPWDTDVALPGKGWIVVRAEKRDQESILAAIRAGDFYASTGVELVDYTVSDRTVTVSVRQKNGARYRTEFIGPNGVVLAQSSELVSSYTMKDATGYVRARITDSNGRSAWTQPHFAAPAVLGMPSALLRYRGE